MRICLTIQKPQSTKTTNVDTAISVVAEETNVEHSEWDLDNSALGKPVIPTLQVEDNFINQ